MPESAAEHRVAERKAVGRERRRRNAVDPVKELEEDKKLLERAAGEIESLQAERGQMADVLKWPRLHNLLLHTSPSP
jgi:hypothetical protein